MSSRPITDDDSPKSWRSEAQLSAIANAFGTSMLDDGGDAALSVALERLSKVELIELVVYQERAIAGLTERVAHLEGIIAKNSRNSSKPPSSDQPGVKPAPAPTLEDEASLKRKPGGQPGHKGHALKRVDNPDEIVVHPTPETCVCGLALIAVLKEARQVFDLPRAAMRVVEHQTQLAKCHCGKIHQSVFPPGVGAATQYGANITALAVYLTHQHMLPISRCADILGDLSGKTLSTGTVLAMITTTATTLVPHVERIKAGVIEAPVLCVDETGMRVGRGLSWLHVAATETLTWMGIHEKRGTVAINEFGVIGKFKGTLVHDGFSAYRTYDCIHSLCNAHHLRELTFVYEQHAQPWAKDMIDFLLLANKAVKLAAGQPLTQQQQEDLRAEYDTLVATGKATNPLKPASGKRGRTAQTFPVNLLKRLDDYASDAMRFTTDPAVPFTNNLGERTMRMLKVKQKTSGCFRTVRGAQNFCVIRSYLATLAKQGRDLLDALVLTALGKPPDPMPT